MGAAFLISSFMFMRKVLSSSWDIIFYLCLKSLSLSLVFIFNRCLWSLVFRLQLPTSCPQPPNLPPPSCNLQPPPCPNQAWFPTGSHIFFQTAHPSISSAFRADLQPVACHNLSMDCDNIKRWRVFLYMFDSIVFCKYFPYNWRVLPYHLESVLCICN